MTDYKFNTNCVHAGYKAGSGDPHVLPIVQSTTYRYYNAADVAALFDLESDSFMYARIGHPDEDALEEGKDYYESDSTGVYFVGTLPYGTYTLVEIVSPTGYEPSGYNESDPSTWVSYELVVDENGVRISDPSNNTIDIKDPEIQYVISLSPDSEVYYADDASGNTAIASVLLKKDDGSYVEYAGADGVSWSTSDSSMMTVDPGGMLHFVGEGSPSVIATFAEGSATKQITVRQHVKKALVTESLSGLVGGSDIVEIVYEVDDVPTFPAGSLSLEVADPSIATAAVQDGKIVVSYHSRGTTTLVVKLDGEQLGNPIPITVDEVTLGTESLTGKVGETKAIDVTWTDATGKDRTKEVANRLTYVVENPSVVSMSGTSATFGTTTGTTMVTVKFDGTQIGRITITVYATNPLTDLSYLFDIKQDPKELTIEGNTSTVDVYTWPKAEAYEYYVSTNYSRSESQRQLDVPAGRVFEQNGVYYYFKESVKVTVGDLGYHDLSTIRGWGLQDKILIVTPPNGQSDEGESGDSSAAPKDNSTVTAEQASGSWISGWQNTSTWHSSSDGSYMYASTDTNAVSIVYSNGRYYVPLNNGSPDYLYSSMLNDSFEVSHLTDGAEHSYHMNSNPNWTETRTWRVSH